MQALLSLILTSIETWVICRVLSLGYGKILGTLVNDWHLGLYDLLLPVLKQDKLYIDSESLLVHFLFYQFLYGC